MDEFSLGEHINDLVNNSDDNNIDNLKKKINLLVDQFNLERIKENKTNENYGIRDSIFVNPQMKSKSIINNLNKKNKVLVVLGKQYLNTNNQIHFETFCLSQYVPLTMKKDLMTPMKTSERLLSSEYPNKKILFVCPKSLNCKNHDNFYYKTFDELLDAGKKYFGVKKNVNFNSHSSSESAIKNYNSLLHAFGNDVNSIYKAFKIVH